MGVEGGRFLRQRTKALAGSIERRAEKEGHTEVGPILVAVLKPPQKTESPQGRYQPTWGGDGSA